MRDPSNDGSQPRESASAAAATAASIDSLMRVIYRLRAADIEWSRLHQQVIEERAAALREIAILKRTRDDLHEANNRYLERARDAEARAEKARVAIEAMIVDRDAAYAKLDALCASAPNKAKSEPVAWRVRVKGDDPEEWALLPAGGGADYLSRPNLECQPLYVAATETEANHGLPPLQERRP